MSRKIKRSVSRLRRPTPAGAGELLATAIALHQEGRLAEAEEAYGRVIADQPPQAEALNLLATLYQQRGEFGRAIPLLRRAIGLIPSQAGYHCNLGSAHRGLGEMEQAIPAFRQALALAPGHPEAQFNLSLTYLDLGQAAEAIAGLRHLLLSRPAFLPAHRLLAQALLGQGELSPALASLREITRLDPQDSAAWCEIGNILQTQNELDQAVTAYGQAIAIRPAYAVAHNNLGNTLVKQGHIHQAMLRYQEALRLDPDLKEAFVNLSWTYKEHGMLAEDVACLRGYLARHPEDGKAHSDMLFSMNYDPGYTPADLYAAAQGWWQQHRPPTADAPVPAVGSAKSTAEGLRLGFLSPDLRQHPVGTFLLPLFKALARRRELHLYCYAEMREADQDEVSQALRQLATGWTRTLGLGTDQAVEAIRRDRLDILIDLAGHSANNRLDIMARQPAPVQMSWLGYVNTTGLPVIHYRLTDAVADPPGAEGYYSERLIRLPDAFFCYEPPAAAPEVGPLPALSSGRLTFGSPNNPAKINDTVIAVWAAILRQVAESRLLLVGGPFSDPVIRDRYLAMFGRHGVAAERLELIPTLSMRDYLELYRRLDIVLDPFPHNGHTVSCHTLWMGVPIVTLAGDRYAGRMGASLLSAVGLPELIAHSPEQYIELACTLARDRTALAELRQSLRTRLRDSPVCDSATFADHFIATLRTIRA